MNKSNQKRKETNPQDNTWNIFTITVILIPLCAVFILPYVIYDDLEPTKTLVWNLNDLEKELSKRVYGQDEAIDIITQTLRKNIETPQINSRQTMFMLLGGPGVGKHHVLNIIKNHIKCIPSTKELPCQVKYQNIKLINEEINATRTDVEYYFDGSLPLFIDFNSLQYSKNSNGINNVLKNMYHYPQIKFYFITGSIMSKNTAESVINNSTEYENLINVEAKLANYDLTHEFPIIDVIIVNFKPLKHNHVTQCLRDQQVFNMTLDYIKDFVPLGCKTR